MLCSKAINGSDATDDLPAAELSKRASNAKLYENWMKLVVHAKMIFNQIITFSSAHINYYNDIEFPI